MVLECLLVCQSGCAGVKRGHAPALNGINGCVGFCFGCVDAWLRLIARLAHDLQLVRAFWALTVRVQID